MILLFEVAGRRLGVPLTSVREVLRACAVEPLPDGPPAVEGVIDVGGRLVPVFDLRRRLGVEPRPVDPGEHFILAEAAGRAVALRADRVDWLSDAPDAAAGLRELGAGWRGVARLPDGLALIHDLDAFLGDAEARALDEALAAAAREPA